MTCVSRPAVPSVVLMLVLAAAFLSPRAAVAQETSCNVALSIAESRYLNGSFDEAIELLDRCISDPALSQEAAQQQAFTLLGRSYYAKGLEDEAKTALEDLLLLVPEYQPDPQFPPSFRRLIEEVRTELQLAGRLPVAEPETPQQPEIVPTTATDTSTRSRASMRNWLLIGGGGALALGVTAAILLGGNGGGGDPPITPGTGFPFPPGRPN